MERKGGSSTAVVTKEELRAKVGKVHTLTQSEEKVVRMLHGAGTELNQPLPRAAGGNEELGDELLLIEMQLMRAWKARLGQSPRNQLQLARIGSDTNATKNKIVRSLRKKKN